MSGCKPADTPTNQNAKLWEKGDTPFDTENIKGWLEN